MGSSIVTSTDRPRLASSGYFKIVINQRTVRSVPTYICRNGNYVTPTPHKLNQQLCWTCISNKTISFALRSQSHWTAQPYFGACRQLNSDSKWDDVVSVASSVELENNMSGSLLSMYHIWTQHENSVVWSKVAAIVLQSVVNVDGGVCRINWGSNCDSHLCRLRRHNNCCYDAIIAGGWSTAIV